MRILIFSLAYVPFIGGAEVAVKKLTDRLTDFEFDMLTVNLDGQQKPQEKVGRINVYRLGKGKKDKYFFPWRAFHQAERMHLKKQYDIIWAIMANQAGLAASFFKSKYKIPCLLTLQEGDSEFDIWVRTWFMRWVYKNIYRRADHIQAISSFLALRAKKMGARCPVNVVPNGIEKGPGVEYRNIVQQSAPVLRNFIYIITVSRLVKKNGIDVLIKSHRYIKDQKVKLFILGDGVLKDKLRTLTKELGLNANDDINDEKNRILFLGSVPNNFIYYYLNHAKIFVRPSRSEGLGSAFLEAMAMGLPVIGTPVGGIPDFLKDKETGLFCKVDNPKDLAEKIQMLLNDDDLYKRLSENGKRLVEEKYQWDDIAQKMEKIFLQMKSR